jgi:hypothetical protein
MHRTTLALGLALSSSSAACSSDPYVHEIAGKATITRLTHAGVENGTFVLDTGDDGKTLVQNGDRWQVDCSGYGARTMHLRDKLKAHDPKTDRGFSSIAVTKSDDKETPSDAVELELYLNLDFWLSACPGAFTKTGNDPYEADVSVSTCEMRQRDGSRTRLESALFHIKGCDTEPP